MEHESERVMRWKAAWESRDIDAIVAMYRPDATHESALVPRLYREAGGTASHAANRARARPLKRLGGREKSRGPVKKVPLLLGGGF